MSDGTLEFISRAEWDARSATERVLLDWNNVAYFVVHYTEGGRDQSVRSIQDWCMNGKGHSDIDYNELIRGLKVYEGRGDFVGGHTYGLNRQSWGVACIGRDGDFTEDDLRALQDSYVRACSEAGRALTIVGHGDAPGRPGGQQTDCPGSQIETWISSGAIAEGTHVPQEPPAPGDWTEEIMKALPTARLGHGDAKTVKTIQGLVNRDLAGTVVLPLAVDGIWGPKTDAAVRWWQVAGDVPNSVTTAGHGDGQFGPSCWRFALDLS